MITPEQKPRNVVERVGRKLQRVVRDTKRRRLAGTVAGSPPSPAADQSLPFSVHMLLGGRELLMAVCAAKSLNLASDRAQRWFFHDDGTLSPNDVQLLTHQFPGSDVIRYTDAIASARTRFAHHAQILHWLERSVLMLKLLDIPRCSVGPRYVMVDADVLFFTRPTRLLESASDATGPTLFNADIDSAYVLPVETLNRTCSVDVRDRFNSGVVVADRDLVNPDRIQSWLSALPLDQPFILHRLEQTLYALSASADARGAENLPMEYDVAFDKDVRKSVCKHYVGAIRHGFELEGLEYLLNDLHFLDRWNRFVNRA